MSNGGICRIVFICHHLITKINHNTKFYKKQAPILKFNVMKYFNLSLLRILLYVIIAVSLSSCNDKEEPAPDNSEIEVNKAKAILSDRWFSYKQVNEFRKSVAQITFYNDRYTAYYNYASRYKFNSVYSEWEPSNFPHADNGTYSLKIDNQDPSSSSFIAEIRYAKDSDYYNLYIDHTDVLIITFISLDEILIQGKYQHYFDGIFKRGVPPEIF